MGNVKRAGDLLSFIFSGQFDPKALERGRVSADLFTTWEKIVAETKIPAAGDHSRIRDLEHGILVIEAEHPGWVQLLQTQQTQLLRHIQKKFPELKIQGISFCLSRDSISRPQAHRAPEDSTVPKIETIQSESGAAASPSPVPEQAPERDQALYETMKSFKKVIQKRNRDNTRN
jgi:hypothetical protein